MRARAGLAAFVAAFAFIAGPAAGAAELVGSARVIDGDTLAVSGTVVRLHGIDAPETGQSCSNAAGRAYACGEAATEALARLVAGGKVACQGNTRDRYDRLVAVCRTRGAELNRAMVAGGWAAAFRHYSDDYATDEADARAARRGMWAGSFQMPWDYRAQAWALAAAAAPRPGCPIKGNISAAGHVYHTPYSRSYDRTRINPARGERWFCSEDEALAAGWRAPVR